jgi:hypothetical protein
LSLAEILFNNFNLHINIILEENGEVHYALGGTGKIVSGLEKL